MLWFVILGLLGNCVCNSAGVVLCFPSFKKFHCDCLHSLEGSLDYDPNNGDNLTTTL